MQLSADVVVIGAGGAGLAAAVAAREAGAGVLVLEKSSALSGTTSRAVGSFAAANTALQRRSGIVDAADAFAEDIHLAWPQSATGSALISVLAAEAGSTLSWLEEMGVVFVGPYPEPPNRVPRMHNAVPNGRSYLFALYRRAMSMMIDIRFDTEVDEIMPKGDGAWLVRARDGKAGERIEVFASRGIILAAGDFSANQAMRARHLGQAAARAIPINDASHGDGHRLAESAGAPLTAMDIAFGPQLRFKVAPFTPWFLRLPPWPWLMRLAAAFFGHAPKPVVRSFVKQLLVSQMSPSDSLFSEGALLVNSVGQAIEGKSMAHALAGAPECRGYIVGDRALAARFEAYPYFISTAPGIAYAYFSDYERGRPDLVHWFDSAAALNAAHGVAAVNIAHLRAPYFVIGPVFAMLTVTEGGAAIDSRMRVLDQSGEIIRGLHAAGANGQGGLLLKGHGLHLAWAFTSGRIAGTTCATNGVPVE